MMELESGTFSASGIPEPVTATLAGPGSWAWTRQTVKSNETRKGEHDDQSCNNLYCMEDYLGGCRFHLAFLLLVLFVGSGVDH